MFNLVIKSITMIFKLGKLEISRGVLSVAIVGLIGIASGFFVMFIDPYDFLFRLKVIFSEGGEVFEMWRKPPVDLYLRVYLFNVTNKDEFLAGREKLRIEEVGPYVYKELLSHENITFNTNGTLTAVPNHPLQWVPELSEGHLEEDQLILPNIALLSIAHVVRDASYFTRFGLNLIIRQTDAQPLVQMSAKEFMMGYKTSLLTLGNKFMPGWITFDKLGLIDRMYDFDGDYETVYTGDDDASKSGLLDTYRGSPDLPQWAGDSHCSNIRGASDGTKFPSYVKPNDSLLFFRKSMCRSQWLVKVNATERSNLNGYWYTFAPNAMDNGYYDPKNKCYCREGNCLPPGLLDVTDCYYGFPIALSYPHFLYSDPSLLNQVEGSKPDVARHETYFIVQPESGLPLDVAVRFQINMALGDLSKIANTERFSNMVLPMLWTEIRMDTLPDSLAARFNLYLNVLPTVSTSAMYLLFICGLSFIGLSVHRLYQMKTSWTTQNRIGSHWSDEENVNDKNLHHFLKVENKRNMSSKELEVYYSSLITPLNQDITFHELQELKEEMV